MGNRPIRKFDNGIEWTQSETREREILVTKEVVQDTLTIPHSLVSQIVYDYLNTKGLINDCDKFELDPDFTHEIFHYSYTLVLERLVVENRDNRIVV
jgi:hypothetical protein